MKVKVFCPGSTYQVFALARGEICEEVGMGNLQWPWCGIFCELESSLSARGARMHIRESKLCIPAGLQYHYPVSLCTLHNSLSAPGKSKLGGPQIAQLQCNGLKDTIHRYYALSCCSAHPGCQHKDFNPIWCGGG